MTHRRFLAVALVTLVLVPLAVVLVAPLFERRIVSPPGATSQSSARPTSSAAAGSIVGVVVNERHEPVVHAVVQAFSAHPTAPPGEQRETAAPLRRASGSASTGVDGRFRISGLEAGEYLVAAEPPGMLSPGTSMNTEIYATTFYPSTLHHQQAAPVSARPEPAILLELVRVQGVRVSGSVVSPSGRPTERMSVRILRRFGDFGSESTVATVSGDGTFEIHRVPPGWYRLSVGTWSPGPNEGRGEFRGEFAHAVIEVRDRDVDGLSLVLGPGASIAGRIVVEDGASIPTPVGLRVHASSTPEPFSAARPISATVAENWSFRMAGLSGLYQFAVSTDRPLFLSVTRMTVNGAAAAASAGVTLGSGSHEVVLYVAPRERPKPTVDRTLSSAALVELFKSERSSWRQFTIAEEIVKRHDASVLPALVNWLDHENRRARGNAAFVFAGLGDPRGFQAITDILTDRSDRPPGEIAGGNWSLRAQIRSDRYYAAHLLGDLRDPRAVPVLVPLLRDEEINDIVPWALGQIGDRRAVAALLAALGDESPSIRVLAIYALETLQAKEALPQLTALLNDHRRANFGARVSVADAAKAAIARLR